MTPKNPFWLEGKSFIPFRKPVVIADWQEVVTGDLVSVCFDRGWRPYILGALSVLERPETWEADNTSFAETMASLGADLIAQFSAPTGGCIADIPSFVPGACEADFVNDGAGPFELVYQGPDKWGEFQSGVGWVATTAYNSDFDVYQKRLELRWDTGLSWWAYGLAVNFDTAVDFAPGGEAARVNNFMILDSSVIAHQLYITHGSDVLNETCYSYQQGAPIQGDTIRISCWCGEAGTEAELDSMNFVLKDFQLYLWGHPYPCE